MGKYYLGLDGGSTYLKAALLKDGKVVRTLVLPAGIDNSGTAKKIVAALCRKYEMDRRDIGYIMATGYSHKILDVADDDISEITAHAYGVRVTAPKGYRPGMVVDIGRHDSKIIYLDANFNVKNSLHRSWKQRLIGLARFPWKALHPVTSTAPVSCLPSQK